MSDKIVYHQVVEMGTFDDSDIFISESGVPDATLDIAKDILEKFSGATFQFVAELDTDVTPNFGAGTVFDTYEANTAYMLIDGSDGLDGKYSLDEFWGELKENKFYGVEFEYLTFDSANEDILLFDEMNSSDYQWALDIIPPKMDVGDLDLGVKFL